MTNMFDDPDPERIKLRFSGFLAMNDLFIQPLWQGYEVFIQPSNLNIPPSLPVVRDNMVLGKNAERYFSSALGRDERFRVIAENIQVKQGKITIGELDFLVNDLANNEVNHIELVCKFYLYDADAHSDEMGKWVGPNRKDSLLKKLDKLKEKQLPLLYRNECREILKRYHLEADKIIQRVCFKAALFVPLHMSAAKFPVVNNDCVKGTYIRYKEFTKDRFGGLQWCVPRKQDWFMNPAMNKDWSTYAECIGILEDRMESKSSALCWNMDREGVVSSIFVVWWP